MNNKSINENSAAKRLSLIQILNSGGWLLILGIVIFITKLIIIEDLTQKDIEIADITIVCCVVFATLSIANSLKMQVLLNYIKKSNAPEIKALKNHKTKIESLQRDVDLLEREVDRLKRKLGVNKTVAAPVRSSSFASRQNEIRMAKTKVKSSSVRLERGGVKRSHKNKVINHDESMHDNSMENINTCYEPDNYQSENHSDND